MSQAVRVTDQESVRVVSLTAPDRRNALDVQMLEAIADAASTADAASVILLQGEGDAFCAGFDVGLMTTQPSVVDTLIARLSEACRALRRCPATVVADVQGAAIAGGCALAVSADVLVARRGAKLGYPVHRLGISPAVTIPVLHPAAGGKARSMLMSGQVYRAEALAAAGMVHQLLEPSEPIAPLITHLLDRSTEAAHATKAWLNALEQADDDNRFDGPVAASRGLRLRPDQR
ncbi:MAG: enoyl-CoA hydratase/isomerase family protein [Phycisphaerales bacterium]|jgi:enoyl-CoA hydratase/carnithine racemase|nr:enoyl-CoA hydratase/isomerase family protein [Phycisphaerales bacterium]